MRYVLCKSKSNDHNDDGEKKSAVYEVMKKVQ